MKFMLILFNDEATFGLMTDKERGAAFGAYMAFNGALVAEGVMVSGEPLQPSFAALQVSAPRGHTETIKGPYGDTPLRIGGIYVIDVADTEAAIAWAARCPAATQGVVEVRPLMSLT